MTGLPPPPKHQRGRRADASDTGSPAQQPLDEKGKTEKACVVLGCVWAPTKVNRDSAILPLQGKSKAWKYLQSSAVA